MILQEQPVRERKKKEQERESVCVCVPLEKSRNRQKYLSLIYADNNCLEIQENVEASF